MHEVQPFVSYLNQLFATRTPENIFFPPTISRTFIISCYAAPYIRTAAVSVALLLSLLILFINISRFKWFITCECQLESILLVVFDNNIRVL